MNGDGGIDLSVSVKRESVEICRRDIDGNEECGVGYVLHIRVGARKFRLGIWKVRILHHTQRQQQQQDITCSSNLTTAPILIILEISLQNIQAYLSMIKPTLAQTSFEVRRLTLSVHSQFLDLC